MNRLKKARELRQEKLDRINELDPVNVENDAEVRSLTTEEKQEIKTLTSEVEELNEEIRDLEKVQEVRSTVTSVKQVTPKPDVANSEQREGFKMSDDEKQRYSLTRAFNVLANPNSKEARNAASFELEISQRLAEERGEQAKGIIVPHEMLQVRNVNKGTPSEGGNFIATDLKAGNFIDLLRQPSVILGKAQILDGLVGDVDIPRLLAGSTGYLVAEDTDITSSNIGAGLVSMQPYTIGANFEVTRKMLKQSSVAMDSMLANDAIEAIRLKLEELALYGTGVDQPLGIANTPGIGSYAMGTNGAALDWDGAVGVETQVNIDNALAGDLNYLTNAKVIGQAKTTAKASGTSDFLYQKGMMNEYPVLKSSLVKATNNKGTGTNLSDMFFGNFADAVLGLWSGIEFVIDPYTQGKKGGLVITAMQDADYAVRRPQSFALVSDIDAN